MPKRAGTGAAARAPGIIARIESAIRNEIDADRNEHAPVRRVILAYSGAAAAAAANPIPFAGLPLLTPIHVAMVLHVGARLGHSLTMETAGEAFKNMLGAIGMSAATRFAAGVFRGLGVPIVGDLLRAPIMFGFTYGLGRVAEDYFARKNAGCDFDPKRARALFEQAVREGRIEGVYADLFAKKTAAGKRGSARKTAGRPAAGRRPKK